MHSKRTCDYKGTQRSILCANRKSGRGEAHIEEEKLESYVGSLLGKDLDLPSWEVQTSFLNDEFIFNAF